MGRTMLTIMLISLFVGNTAWPAFTAFAEETKTNARLVMERNYFAGKVKTMRSKATLMLINGRGEARKRAMEMAGKLQPNGIDSNVVIRFVYPPDVKGTSFLQHEHAEGDDNLWIYLPALHKTRRLVANNKKDSFFGSDFSYCDILPPKVDLYHHDILRSETVEGHDCYVIESVPKTLQEKNNSGYSKKIAWVRKDNSVEVKIVYYDLAGELLKTQVATKHTLLDPDERRWIALHKEMVNHQTGHKTIFDGSDVKVGMPIPDTFFTTRNLQRPWRW